MTDRRRVPLAARLPFPALLAVRYLRSTRRDSFISFLSLVATCSIALGVASLIVALAALSGFQEALKGEILARTPSLQIVLPPGSDIAAAAARVREIPGVVEVRTTVAGRGWLIVGDRVRPVSIEGFDGSLPPTFPGASDSASGLYVTAGLADNWGLETGDGIELASNRPSLTPLGPRPRVVRLPLRGTFPAGRTEQIERVALPLAVAVKLLAPVTPRISANTADLGAAQAAALDAAVALPDAVEIASWKDLNRPLFFALRLEKAVMFIAVFLIVVVGALALVSDLNLIITTKRSEIGMLSAMGASAGDLRRAFLLLAAMLVGLGSIAGGVFGLLASWALDTYRLITLPSQVYFVDHVPFLVRSADVVVVLGTTTALALIFAFSAAGRAARLEPVEALRR